MPTVVCFKGHGHTGIIDILLHKGAGPVVGFQIPPEQPFPDGGFISRKTGQRHIHLSFTDLLLRPQDLSGSSPFPRGRHRGHVYPADDYRPVFKAPGGFHRVRRFCSGYYGPKRNLLAMYLYKN